MASIMAAVEPLPLVPPTCTTGYAACGSPSARAGRSRRARSRSTPRRARANSRASACASAGPAPRAPGQRAQEARQLAFEIAPMHDEVEHAVLEQELGALESVGQLLTDGLLDDAGAGEADQRPRLGHDDVAEHGEAGRHSARGRMQK